jgi:hypothetical protein
MVNITPTSSSSKLSVEIDSNHFDQSFISKLVEAVTGILFTDINQEIKASVVHDCLQFFVDYIIEYVTSYHSVKDAIRIKTAFETGENMFQSFPELEGMYSEAYRHFLDSLKNYWETV